MPAAGVSPRLVLQGHHHTLRARQAAVPCQHNAGVTAWPWTPAPGQGTPYYREYRSPT